MFKMNQCFYKNDSTFNKSINSPCEIPKILQVKSDKFAKH